MASRALFRHTAVGWFELIVPIEVVVPPNRHFRSVCCQGRRGGVSPRTAAAFSADFFACSSLTPHAYCGSGLGKRPAVAIDEATNEERKTEEGWTAQ